MRFKRSNLNNKPRVSLFVSDFSNHTKLSFRGRRELSTGLQKLQTFAAKQPAWKLQLLQQNDQKNRATGHCCYSFLHAEFRAGLRWRGACSI